MAITDSVNCACSDTTNNRTLKNLRDDLMRRLGYGAQVASPPPGMADLLNAFLIEAQELLYRRYAVLRTERFYSWPLTNGVRRYGLPANAEATPLPTPVISGVTTATTGGTLAAATYSYRVAARNTYGRTLASSAVTVVTTGSTSVNTINWPAVTVPAGVSGVTGYDVFGRVGGSEQLLASLGNVLSYADTGSAAPSGALPTSNTTAECPKLLDPRSLTWVGIERDGIWQPLECGIPPELYTHGVTGRPQRYEIRQCIELWPAPEATSGNLVIKGHFGLEAFAVDADKTTIDDRAVFLLALANAKAHYRQPDANNYVGQLEVFIGNLVAGSHHARRYVPGHDGRADGVYVQPRPTVPFA